MWKHREFLSVVDKIKFCIAVCNGNSVGFYFLFMGHETTSNLQQNQSQLLSFISIHKC